jgi:hypothetical protein
VGTQNNKAHNQAQNQYGWGPFANNSCTPCDAQTRHNCEPFVTPGAGGPDPPRGGCSQSGIQNLGVPTPTTINNQPPPHSTTITTSQHTPYNKQPDSHCEPLRAVARRRFRESRCKRAVACLLPSSGVFLRTLSCGERF